MTLSQILKKLDKNIGRSLLKTPSSLKDISKQSFLTNVSPHGINTVWNDMKRAGKIVPLDGDVYGVAEQFKKDYTGKVQPIF